MRWLMAVLLVGLALSGCFKPDDPAPTPSETPIEPGSSTPTTTTPPPTTSPSPDPTGPGGVKNRLPIGSIEASADNGTIPLTVTFTLRGTDADDDPLSWLLDFGDGNETEGTQFPATRQHTYEQSGLFNATYFLTDSKATVNYTVSINITALGSSITHIIEGNTTLEGNPSTSGFLGANGCAGFNAGETGGDCVFGEIPPELGGHSFVYTSDADAPDYELRDSCDPVLGVVLQADGGPMEGSLPADTGCVIMWTYSASVGSFRFEIH